MQNRIRGFCSSGVEKWEKSKDMNAKELFDTELAEGRREDLLFALFYGREDFALLPYHVESVRAAVTGAEVFLLSAGGAGRAREHFVLSEDMIRHALHISPERLLSHPEHLMVTGVREGKAFSFVSTYDRSELAEDGHLLSLLHEFLSWTGIDTKEALRAAEESGRENLKRAEEKSRP